MDTNYFIERYKVFEEHRFCCGAECEDADEAGTDATRVLNCARCEPCNLCEDCSTLDRLHDPVCLDCLLDSELEDVPLTEWQLRQRTRFKNSGSLGVTVKSKFLLITPVHLPHDCYDERSTGGAKCCRDSGG